MIRSFRRIIRSLHVQVGIKLNLLSTQVRCKCRCTNMYIFVHASQKCATLCLQGMPDSWKSHRFTRITRNISIHGTENKFLRRQVGEHVGIQISHHTHQTSKIQHETRRLYLQNIQFYLVFHIWVGSELIKTIWS